MNKQPSFHQSLSIFTCRIWLHYNNLRGDTRHSYLNDFATDLRNVNHFLGHRSLMNMIADYRANNAFKNAVIYDNINNVPVYDEIFVLSQNKYRVRLNCNCKFMQDEKGNYFYHGYESYEPATGELIFNAADQAKVRSVSNAAFKYVSKRKSMPGVVHPEASQNQTARTTVGFNLDSLKNLSPYELSKVADYLLKMKGQAA